MTDGANNISRYRSSLAVPAFLLLSIGLLFLLNVFGANDTRWIVPFVGISSVILLFAVLIWRTRIEIDARDRLRYVLLGVFSEETIPVRDITRVTKCSTYVFFAFAYKSLCVEYVANREEKILKISHNIFSASVLKALFTELKRINPGIAISNDAERF